MSNYEFQVQEKSVGGAISWEAIELGTGNVIDLPNGGNNGPHGKLMGCYPEIETYLSAMYQVSVQMVYITQIDQLQIDPDGKSHWTFHRQAAEVLVHDIPRVVWRFTPNF
ncbi:hypothetical protein WT59_20800 [Burkholderia territorii]|uniref:hypothetical protein n=1 Tax=Burkholderia territorii TaxID=1503055 RepID=UPI00076CBF50|nr:hypothetical protein [Burkholderia territorii]KWH09755.1 hypothetical protein WT59_20800 [Burkholderia territorii]